MELLSSCALNFSHTRMRDRVLELSVCCNKIRIKLNLVCCFVELKTIITWAENSSWDKVSLVVKTLSKSQGYILLKRLGYETWNIQQMKPMPLLRKRYLKE